MTQDAAHSLDTFIQVYEKLTTQNVVSLAEIYHPDVIFEDPAHRVEGWPALSEYFSRLFASVPDCRFEIHESVAQGDIAYVQWTMQFRHPRLSGGKSRTVKGCSRLQFEQGKVRYHRDYFDMGEMIYEGIPVLGRLISHLKARL